MPLISAVMPSYNHAAYIGEAIASVLSQSVRDIELIIIDDASTDGSDRIIDDWRRKDERITAVIHQVNQGIARTINEGCRIAQGKYIAFIASDDVWIPGKLEKQLSILCDDDNLVVHSEGTIIDQDGLPTGELFSQVHHAEGKKKNGDIFEELMLGNYIFGSTVIVKRENLHGIRFNERLECLNDFQFYVDISRLCQYRFINEPLAKYRIHEKNTISANVEGHYYDYPVLVEHIFREYGDKISNGARIELFLSSVDRLVKIISRRNSKIMEITEYARSLEEVVRLKDAALCEMNTHIQQLSQHVRSHEEDIHQKNQVISENNAQIQQMRQQVESLQRKLCQKDTEIGKLETQNRQITQHIESLVDSLHQKDTEINQLNSKVELSTQYSNLLEEQIKTMKSSFFAWLNMRKQA